MSSYCIINHFIINSILISPGGLWLDFVMTDSLPVRYQQHSPIIVHSAEKLFQLTDDTWGFLSAANYSIIITLLVISFLQACNYIHPKFCKVTVYCSSWFFLYVSWVCVCASYVIRKNTNTLTFNLKLFIPTNFPTIF